MSENKFIKYRVRELIEHHMSGPSPTCEERPVADSKEWGAIENHSGSLGRMECDRTQSSTTSILEQAKFGS